MANLFSQLKQWSDRVRGSSPKPSSRTVRQRKATDRSTSKTNGRSENSQANRENIRVGRYLDSGSSNGSNNGSGNRPSNGAINRPINGLRPPLNSPSGTRGRSNARRNRALVAAKPPYKKPAFWLLLLVGVGIAGSSVWFYRMWSDLNKAVPDVTKALTYERNGTITVKADNGEVLQKVGPTSQESLSYDEIPEVVSQAFIAAEDRRFYEHHGVDYRSIARASVANLTSGGVVEGASTITQQLARLTFLNQDRSFQRKFKEAILAVRLEKELGKKKVLERYLNLVYLGAGAYGVADAAWIYFGKTVDQLSVADIALIAGMAPAPTVYSPLVDPVAARKQRDKVISRMEDNGVITTAQANEAYQEDVTLDPKEPKYLYSKFPYFTIYIKKQLSEILTPEEIEAGGLVVETSLNTKWQEAAEKTVKEVTDDYGQWQRFGQASLVAIDPKTGQIKAMVGGTDFDGSQFNRVTQAQRQPGSTFKPFVYATAIATGMSPYKTYDDAHYVVDGYEPKNYSKSYSGTIDLRRALTNSVNIVAVKLLVDVGFDPVIAMAHRMGIESNLLGAYSLALGSSEVNLLELTSAYGTFADEGKHITAHGITRITDSQGEVMYEFDEKPKQAMDKDTASIMTWMLRSVVNSGTGGNAAISGRQVAGKTGTSEDYRDLWFVGYTPQIVAGVWMGNDDNTPTRGASSTAALAWYKFVSQFIDALPVEQFPELPELGGRKGTIKAKPINPGRVRSDKAGASRDEEEPSRRAYSEDPYEEPSREEDPEPTYDEPAPAYDEPAPAENEPAPAENNAPSGGNDGRSAPPPAPAPAPTVIVPPPAPSSPPPAPPPAPAPVEPPQPSVLNN